MARSISEPGGTPASDARPLRGPGDDARSFWSALRSLPDNPLARREWRGLRHQARDWRLWVGLRIPKDARGWGVPAVVWFCLAPYVVWLAMRAGNRVAPDYFSYQQLQVYYVDILALCLTLLGIYLGLTAMALMAPAITRERERETWETLRTTVASPHEILLGLAVGRLGPLLTAYAAVGLVWILTSSHYTALLARYAPFGLDPLHLAFLVGETLALAAAAGTLSLAASAWCRTSGQAMIASITLTTLLGGAVILVHLVPSAQPDALTSIPLAVVVTVCGYVTARRAVVHP